MSVDECYDVYTKLAKTIFKPKRWKYDVLNRGLDLISANERYDSSKLEEMVQQIIQQRTGSKHAMLKDPHRASPCKVFVTTVRADDEELLLLRSYENKQQPDLHSSSFEMWEALRATSAASTYFKAYRHQNVGYVDGAFKSNNPIFEVHHEASDLWPERDIFLVSIGTGTKPSAPLGGHVLKLARSMTKLVTATEGSWLRFHRTHKQLAEDNRLFRFSAPGIGEVDLGNYKMIANVSMRTETYLRETDVLRNITACSNEMLRVQTKEYTTVDRLSGNERDATICHFFFKAGEESRQDSHQALCAILHQMFRSNAKAIQIATKEYASKDDANLTENVEALWEMLCQASDSMPSKQIVCVIDALDECSKNSRNRFIDLLVKTFPQMVGSRKLLGKLKIFVTSRPWPDIESRFRYLSCVRLRGENEAALLSQDIETMVKAKVDRLKADTVLSPEACSILETTLAQGADRTFLWASLVLETVSRLPSRKLSAVKDTLKVLPADLDQLYETALSDVEDRGASIKLLQIVLAATRPLTLEEINMALNIGPEHDTVKDLLSDIEPDMEYTVKRLGGFFLRIMNSTVYLVHQTARDFLLENVNTKSTAWRHCINISEGHSVLAQSAIRFLLLDGWPSRDMTPSRECDVQVSNRKLLKTLPPAAAGFYEYAAQNWPTHTQKQEEEIAANSVLGKQIASLCNLEGPSWRTWWYLFGGEDYFSGIDTPHEQLSPRSTLGRYPLHYAAGQGFYAVVMGLIASQSCSITSRNHKDLDCLVVASLENQLGVVRWLLANFEDSSFQLGTALQGAIAYATTRMVSILVDTGVDLNQIYPVPHTTMGTVKTVLEQAVGRPRALEFLLGRDAGDIDLAIIEAAQDGVAASLKILLGAQGYGIDDRRQRTCQAALKAANEHGRVSTRKILLDAGTPEPEGNSLSEGLNQGVTRGCSTEDIRALVDAGARDNDGEALLARAMFGEVDGVKTLLEVLEYSPDIVRRCLLSFFDTYMGVEMREYLQKTIERVLSSGNRRISTAFAIKPLMGQGQSTNEEFLTLLSAKNARLPATRYRQAVCYSIALDENLAVFLIRNRDILQEEPEAHGNDEFLALACLWGRVAIIEHILGATAGLKRKERLDGVFTRAAALSGNVDALSLVIKRGGNLEPSSIKSNHVGDEFAYQWNAIEMVLGLDCTTTPLLDLAARLGYRDMMVQLSAIEEATGS
ncbi:hypothetical protein EsH8_IX_000140 [Colletotrichum jinshuiense]